LNVKYLKNTKINILNPMPQN